jgi:signal transduction histidine kinase
VRAADRLSDLLSAWSERITGRHVRVVIVVIVLIYALFAYARGMLHTSPRPGLHGTGLGVVVLNLITVGGLACGIWLLRADAPPPARRRRVGIAMLLVTVVASLALYWLVNGNGEAVILTMMALWVLINNLTLPWGVSLVVAAMAAYGIVGEAARNSPDYGLLAAFVGLALGATANRQRKQAQQETAVAEANSVILAERSHIAREIHDILAHSLSAQIVHLEGARMLLSRDGDRVQALDRVERAQHLARAGLEETRRALATLRGESPPPDEALAELAEEFHVLTGKRCEVEVTGTPRELSPAAGLAVIRTAQEALTNVRKHAPGAQVRLRLAYADGQVELDVTDTGGTEPALEDMGSGYGLVGMRERAELIGGTLETGPDGKGFRVSLRVPA